MSYCSISVSSSNYSETSHYRVVYNHWTGLVDWTAHFDPKMCLDTDRYNNNAGVGTKPGLWTLDWTMDWIMDWFMDSILDLILDSK